MNRWAWAVAVLLAFGCKKSPLPKTYTPEEAIEHDYYPEGAAPGIHCLKVIDYKTQVICHTNDHRRFVCSAGEEEDRDGCLAGYSYSCIED